jgi:hypothetical protein
MPNSLIKGIELLTEITYQECPAIGRKIGKEEIKLSRRLQEARYKRYIEALPLSEAEKKKILSEYI